MNDVEGGSGLPTPSILPPSLNQTNGESIVTIAKSAAAVAQGVAILHGHQRNNNRRSQHEAVQGEMAAFAH